MLPMSPRLIESLDDCVAVPFKCGKGIQHRIEHLHSKRCVVSVNLESCNDFALAFDTRLDRSDVPIGQG
jgi:hypothetical protein